MSTIGQSSRSVTRIRLPNSSVSNALRAVVSRVKASRIWAGVSPVRLMVNTRLSHRGRVMWSMTACTPARSRRPWPRSSTPASSVSLRVALAMAWSNPRACLVCRFGEWVSSTRRCAPRVWRSLALRLGPCRRRQILGHLWDPMLRVADQIARSVRTAGFTPWCHDVSLRWAGVLGSAPRNGVGWNNPVIGCVTLDQYPHRYVGSNGQQPLMLRLPAGFRSRLTGTEPRGPHHMVTIVPIETPTLGDRSYLAHDGEVALVVDPQRDIDRVLQVAEAAGVRITHVFETHIHNDYVTGGLALAKVSGAAYHVNAADEVAYERVLTRDRDVIDVSDALRIRVIATPGHTYTHLSYSLE